MGLWNKLLGKKQEKHITYVECQSDNGFLIRIISDNYLPEEKIDTIASVVYTGIVSQSSLDDIATEIIIYSGYDQPITLNRLDNGIEVIL